MTGSLLFLVALLQLPLTVIFQNTRPGLPFYITGVQKEGLRIDLAPQADRTVRRLLRDGDVLTRIGSYEYDTASWDGDRLIDVLAETRIGDTLRVDVLRDGGTESLDIVLDQPRARMHGAYVSITRYLTNAVGPLIILLIALIVLMRRPRRRDAALYFLLSASMSLWLLTSASTSMMMPWWQALRPVTLYIPGVAFALFIALLLHFTLVFPEDRWLRHAPRVRVVLLYTPYTLLLAAVYVLPPLTGLDRENIVLTVANYVLYTASPVLAVIALLQSQRRSASRMTRKLVRTILAGIAVFGAGIMMTLLLELAGTDLGVDARWLLYIRLGSMGLAVLALPSAFGYAILRYGFLDVRVIFRRTTVYALLAAAVSLAFLSCVVLLRESVSALTGTEVLLVSAVLAGVAAVVLSASMDRIQKFVDTHIFREEHRTSTELQALSRRLVNTLRRDELLSIVTRDLPALLGLRSASVFAVDEQGVSQHLAGAASAAEHLPALMQHAAFKARLAADEVVHVASQFEDPARHDVSVAFAIAARNGEYVLAVLGEKENGRPFGSAELHELRAVADSAALGWKNAALSEELQQQERMKKEIEIAHTIQAAMLPRETPRLEGYDIAAVSTPAREVGGDFFDFIETADGRLAVVIGDVADKGVSAAMVMASSISTIRFAAEQDVSPRAILSRANERLFIDTRRHMFVAVFLGVLDTDTGSMIFTNAGLPKPLLQRDGESFLIDWTDNGQHLPLGARSAIEFHEQELPLEAGDILLLYTDGVIEGCNASDEEFGVKRLRDALRAVSDLSADEIRKHICDEIHAFTGRADLSDDLTLVVLKVTRP
ncbi:MAG: SpoIIE family protein phosphatase [Ignavibacteriae bacterium]|nr:SpoIIE family protein phosphatase [Ignavibacteriota bacterium]